MPRRRSGSRRRPWRRALRACRPARGRCGARRVSTGILPARRLGRESPTTCGPAARASACTRASWLRQRALQVELAGHGTGAGDARTARLAGRRRPAALHPTAGRLPSWQNRCTSGDSRPRQPAGRRRRAARAGHGVLARSSLTRRAPLTRAAALGLGDAVAGEDFDAGRLARLSPPGAAARVSQRRPGSRPAPDRSAASIDLVVAGQDTALRWPARTA